MNDIKPKYKFLASVEGVDFKLEDIPCEIYIPDRVEDGIRIIFKASNGVKMPIAWPHEFSMTGKIKGLGNGSFETVNSKKMYFSSGTTERSGTRVAESQVFATPIDLTITTPLKDENYSVTSDSITGVYYLTPSFFLSPRKTVEYSYTGNVTVKDVIFISYTFPNGDSLVFDKYYKHIEKKEMYDSTLTFSELVARFDFKRTNHKAINFEQIDDFLMLTSFADRQRCACLGWETHSDSQIVRYYRGDMSVPVFSSKHGYNDTLIEYLHYEKFISKAYEKFTKSSDMTLLRQAIYGVINRSSTIESNYLRLYSSLETLIYIYRKENNLEMVLEATQWTKLRKSIEQTIKNNVPAGKESRKRLYEKLPEINRVSFAEAYEAFCSFYEVDTKDLWPISNRIGGASLTDIRNRIVHGNHYYPFQYQALVSAGEHLRWTLERMILNLLDWPFEKSKVSSSFLSNYPDIYKGWEKDRDILSSIDHEEI